MISLCGFCVIILVIQNFISLVPVSSSLIEPEVMTAMTTRMTRRIATPTNNVIYWSFFFHVRGFCSSVTTYFYAESTLFNC